MTHNVIHGTYRTSRDNIYKSFDKLPLSIRRALSDSIDDWIPQVVLTAYNQAKKYYPVDEAEQIVLNMIERWNNEESTEHWYRMRRMQNKGIDYRKPIRCSTSTKE